MMAPRVKAFIRTPCVMLSDGSLASLLLSYPKPPRNSFSLIFIIKRKSGGRRV
jgi:hypothetical protein